MKELDLRGDNSLLSPTSEGDDYIEMIEALRLNQTISRVNLSYRFLSNLTEGEQFEFLQVIGSLPKLQHLRFATSGITGRPLRILNAGLAKSDRHLKSLEIQSIHFKDNVYFKTEGVSNTNDTEFVEFLSLLGNQLKGSIESFTLLDAEDTFDVDALVRVLLTLPNLHDVILQAYSPFHQRLTQQSMIRLFASNTIRSLTLRRLGLGPILSEPIMMLEDNHILESLSLEQNGLDFSCGMSIAYILSVNRTCRQLNLSFNSIPDDCGAVIVAALGSNTTLTSLDLTANILKENTCRRIEQLLMTRESVLQVLTLNQNPLGDEGGIMIATGLHNNSSSLKELSLDETGISEVTCSVLIASLQTNTALERLSLANNKLGDPTVIGFAVALEHNSTLNSLNVRGNNLHDPTVVRFAGMLKVNNTIERLNLGNNPMLTTVAYEALERVLMDDNYSLKHLWLPTSIERVSPQNTIPCFLRLNRMGRKRLLDELDNAQLWMESLHKAALSDLDTLYYLTRVNPPTMSWIRT